MKRKGDNALLNEAVSERLIELLDEYDMTQYLII